VPVIEKSKDGQTPLQLPINSLTRTGYRLPTEAEWEYACRAGAVTSRPYGTADALLGNYAWYVNNSTGRARPVGTKKPNDFGMFDMLGNAWEWCQDAFDSGRRVLRGGGFLSQASELESASRMGFHPHLSLVLAGLRVARTCP
jgi:formylglycine-generating enzyme required for sulfatase activity